MSEHEDARGRKTGSFLELGWRFLELGWMTLDLAAVVVKRLLPEAKPRQVEEEHALDTAGRASDRVLASDSQMERRERWGTLLVVCCFLLSLLGAAGFLIGFWSGHNNTAVMGGGLALLLGGMGVALVVWARLLMTPKEAVEPRHELPSPPSQRAESEKALCDGVRDVRRRTLLGWMGFTMAALMGGVVVSLVRSLGVSPDSSLFSRVWKSGQRLVTIDGKPVSLSSLQPGSTVTVYPEDKIGSERAQTVLIRVQEQLLQLPDDRAHWAPSGYVAYSRVCTHAGCPVGEYEASQGVLLCPCHQSTFDVLRAAAPSGGPAARPLPQLPLYADADGTLRAGGGFTAPPGPGFWGIS